MKTFSKFMEGKKTLSGIAIALIGVLGFSQYITADQTAQVVDLLLQLVGLGLAVYGRVVAKP